MLYVDTTPEEWSEKHGLETETMKCCGCLKEFPVDVPIVIKGYAGFEMRKHGCPSNRLGATFTPTSEEEKLSWRKIIGPKKPL